MINVTQENRRIRSIAFNLFIFSLSIYLLTASGFIFYHTDASKLRIEVIRSIVERQDLSIPENIGMKGSDGRYYSWLDIGSALLAVPFYIAGKVTGITPETALLIINQLATAATGVLIFIFLISLGYSQRASLLVALFFGLGTFAWPYAKFQFNRPIEAFFILLSVYCMMHYCRHKKISLLMGSSLALGVAFITRSTSLIVLPSLFLMMIAYYSKKHVLKENIRLVMRDIILFCIGVLPFLFLSFWYNHYRFGSIFTTGYQLIAQRLEIDFFSGASLPTGLAGLLISPGKGFFFYSPVAIVFFFSIRSFSKKHLELAICFIYLILSYILFHSKYIFWHGDWAWGPRHIFMLTPFFLIPIAELIDSRIWMKMKIFKILIYSIFAVSFIIQIAAVSVDFHKYFYDLRFIKKEKFIIMEGPGVQPIIHPPKEIYHDWKRSPIRAQFISIYTIARDMKSYRYVDVEPKEDATVEEQIEACPFMHVFDFWWIHKYFMEGSYSGFIGAFLICLITIYSSLRLLKLSTNNFDDNKVLKKKNE